MDTAIQALLVLSAFSAVHERVLEMIRAAASKLRGSDKPGELVDVITIGSLNWLPAVVLAVATHANLLALFQRGSDGTSAFVIQYLDYSYKWGFQDYLGTILMGFAASLGSRFWHDLAFGLMEIRQRTKEVASAASQQKAIQTAADRPSAAVDGG